MARRSYDQFCSLARTLDVVGDRWTLLIVRELMLGPKRFSDLTPALPGIGKNLLSDRLRHLQDHGLVARRELPPPAASRVYELTEDGRALGPALAELGRWGIERLEQPPPDVLFRPAWAMFPLAYMADSEAARGVREVYEFRIGGESFHIRVDDGSVVARTGPAERPDLVVTMSPDTLRELFAGELQAVDAVTGGRIEIEGPPDVLQDALAVLTGAPEPTGV
jgi:DNA-binding HxlR family transcriptional regulator